MEQTVDLPHISMYTPAELRRAGIVYNGALCGGVASAGAAIASMAFSLPAYIVATALFGVGVVVFLLFFLPDPSPAPPGNWASLLKAAAELDAPRSTLATWANTNRQLTRADVRRFKRFCRQQSAEVVIQDALKADETARKRAMQE